MNIQWYPGHMTKTRRMMAENISMVDIVIELLDARIPYSSKNPDIDKLANNKHRIIVLNKSDLADDKVNNGWKAYFENLGYRVVLADSVSGKGIDKIVDEARDLMAEKIERLRLKGRIFVPIRSMIVGIPNVGKSTLINKYVGKSMAKTGDRPGVTRSKQWVKIKKDFELLDTPGILWPKFDDVNVGIALAITGAINDDILDISEISLKLIDILVNTNPKPLIDRYKIELDDEDTALDILTKIGVARGFKIKGGEVDLNRASIIVVDEFRGGKLGRISLETPEKFTNNEN